MDFEKKTIRVYFTDAESGDRRALEADWGTCPWTEGTIAFGSG
jgi:hypothetical protein